MSTASLPSYVAPSLDCTPSYTAEPRDSEQRIALADRLRSRPSGNFVKESKRREVRLRLNAQEDNVALPIYGSGGLVEGTIELRKTEGISDVQVQIEGRLRLKEIAESGTATAKLCLNTAPLWIKDPSNPICPSSLHFALALPDTFTYEGKTYPLPPTFDVKLSGLPGFVATTDYSVTVLVSKPTIASSLTPRVKPKGFQGLHLGQIVVSTPFRYYPRSRPANPLPFPLVYRTTGFEPSPEWNAFDSVLSSRSRHRQDIMIKLYIPSSRTFCMSLPIPFHLTLKSSAISLAAYLSMMGPTASSVGHRPVTRIQLMRQTTVDVRNTMVEGVKTDMWRIDCIGEGTFRLAGDAPTSIAFSGEIVVDNSTKIPGFRAAGLSLKDCILFSVFPLDLTKSPFGDVRQVIPIRLATEPWTANGTGIGATRNTTTWERSTPSPLMAHGG